MANVIDADMFRAALEKKRELLGHEYALEENTDEVRILKAKMDIIEDLDKCIEEATRPIGALMYGK